MDIQQSRAIIGQGDSCKAILCVPLADARPYLLHLVGGRERKQRRLQMTRHRQRLTLVSPEKDVLVGDRRGWKLAGFSTAPIGTSRWCRIGGGGNGITNHK